MIIINKITDIIYITSYVSTKYILSFEPMDTQLVIIDVKLGRYSQLQMGTYIFNVKYKKTRLT